MRTKLTVVFAIFRRGLKKKKDTGTGFQLRSASHLSSCQTNQSPLDKRRLYLQATSTAAGWLRICPLLDQAMHSHLNLSLPKYSSTSLRVILIEASTFRIPVWGSTKSCCIGGELADDEYCFREPLQRKYTCNACTARHCSVAGLFLMTKESVGSSRNTGRGTGWWSPSDDEKAGECSVSSSRYPSVDKNTLWLL